MMLVYKYALKAPITNDELVRDQMRKAHAYRNQLTEIECSRRAKLRALGGESEAVLAATHKRAHESLRDANVAIKAYKSKHRTRKVPDALTDAAKAAKEARKAAAIALFAYRKSLIDSAQVQAQMDQANEEAALARVKARTDCGVYWGSYLIVEAAEKAARQQPLYDGTDPNDPRFVRWDGQAAVGVQLQGGLSVAELFSAEDTRLGIVAPTRWPGKRGIGWQQASELRADDMNEQQPASGLHTDDAVDPDNDDPPIGFGQARHTPEERKRRWLRLLSKGGWAKPRHLLRMRVSSDGRAPIWAEWPLVMHRPLPEDAIIKWAHVHLRKIGPREEWYLTFTLECGERRRWHRRTGWGPIDKCGTGAIAIDLAWRAMRDGSMRVAVAVDEQGKTEELALSPGDLGALTRASELRSDRDKLFDIARPWLKAVLDELNVKLAQEPVPATTRTTVKPTQGASYPATSEMLPASGHRADDDPAKCLPAWLVEGTKTMHLWKSQGRLAAIAIRWRSNRFAGDDAAFAAIEQWRIKDKHLWLWESSQRKGGLLRRRDIYRNFAARLARTYGTLVLEQFDLRTFAVLPQPEMPETQQDDKARAQRHLVAPSELRLVLTQAFLSRTGEVAQMPAFDTTRECNICHVVETFDAGAKLRHTCVNGHAWDQDENAGENLLARWRERPGDAKNMGGARKPKKTSKHAREGESAYQRARRLRAERQGRIATAREAGASAAE